MLMMRIMLATVCSRLTSSGLVIKLNFCSVFEHKVWSRFRSWSSGEILKLKFGQYFAADAWLRLWSLILVEILKLLLMIWSLSLVEMLIFGWDFEVDAWSRFWRWNLIKICVRTCLWPKEIILVGRTQPLGPLYLWQFFICQEVFDSIDVNKDGSIVFEEFLRVSICWSFFFRKNQNIFSFKIFQFSIWYLGPWSPNDQFEQGGNTAVHGGDIEVEPMSPHVQCTWTTSNFKINQLL